MKRIIVAVTILSLAAAGLSALEALVLETDGTVEIRVTSDDEWQPLEEQTVVPVGATISTGFDSSAVVEVGPDAQLNIDSLSRLTIEELIEREGVVESDLELSVGRVRGEVRRTEDRQTDFEVRSPTATASVRGTSFEFDGVNLSVSEGQVEISNRFNERSSVSQGERSSADEDNPPASGDASREADSTVNIYTAGVDERGESTATGRDSASATLRVNLELSPGE